MTNKMLNLMHSLHANSLKLCTINFSINAMYIKSGGHLHLLYRYKHDSSVYFDGHLLFSHQLHKEISMVLGVSITGPRR